MPNRLFLTEGAMPAVTVSRVDDRLIAVKKVSASRAAEAEREAHLLRQLDHPGIVRYLDLRHTDDGGRALHTLFVSSDTWATRPLADPLERAAGIAALAATVADLHDMGVAHRHLRAVHVLHGDGDRPVLCSLARAGEASADNIRADMEALADLTYDDGVARGPLSGKLSALADATRAGQLSARDLSRRLDRLLARRSLASGGRLADWRRLLQRVPRKAVAVVIGLAGATGAAVLLLGLLASRSGEETAVTRSVGTLPAGAAGRVEDPPLSAPGMPPQADAAVQPGLIAPDDTRTEGATEQGPVLEHGGRRYAIGIEGDIVITGDWDCDGEDTPAIVRPDSGAVVLFETWPNPGEAISMPARWQLEGVKDAQSESHGACDFLRVHTASGSRLLNPKAQL